MCLMEQSKIDGEAVMQMCILPSGASLPFEETKLGVVEIPRLRPSIVPQMQCCNHPLWILEVIDVHQHGSFHHAFHTNQGCHTCGASVTQTEKFSKWESYALVTVCAIVFCNLPKDYHESHHLTINHVPKVHKEVMKTPIFFTQSII